MTRIFTCSKCETKFTKEIPSERAIVVCPICGMKQRFRYKVMDSNGESWQEADPYDDSYDDPWNNP